MEKTSSTQELENKFTARALMIEKVLGSAEARIIWENCFGYNYMRMMNTRAILFTRCSMLWEMAAEMNKLNK